MSATVHSAPAQLSQHHRSRPRIFCRSKAPTTSSFMSATPASPPTSIAPPSACRLVAYAGPETGQRDRSSYVLQQGKIRFVLTTPLRGGNAIAEHVGRHGDGVKVIALWVDDARARMERNHQSRRRQRRPALRSRR